MFHVSIDPNNEFKNAERSRILEAVGILFHWLDQEDPRPARQQFEEKYGFPIWEMKGGKIDAKGIYSYPEDPSLYPLMSVVRDDEIVYFYQYAIVGIVNRHTGEQFVTRMD